MATICPFGYALSANGADPQRQRHKWICAHACREGATPLVRVSTASYPPNECPYLGDDHPHGRIVNVGQRFADGSMRLVRDVPFGGAEWKRLYHRARNAVEGRHAMIEACNLKRMPVYGDPRSRAFSFQVDMWDNLLTLVRLMREATAATGN